MKMRAKVMIEGCEVWVDIPEEIAAELITGGDVGGFSIGGADLEGEGPDREATGA